jgi:hypothetical protein
MKEEKLTHYRKVFKSDHLGVADLEEMIEEGKSLKLTIKDVKQEIGVSVAGRKGNHNIAYFKESVKPLVLNATNSKIVRKFAGGTPFVENWKDILVEVYIDADVKMKGEIVGGVRIRPVQPPKQKPILNPQSEKWDTAKQRVSEGMTFEDLQKHYLITEEDFILLCG